MSTTTEPKGWTEAVLAALEAVRHRVRLCPRCGAAFVKAGKQKFCEPDCARKEAWMRYAAYRPPRDHAAEYARRKAAS